MGYEYVKGLYFWDHLSNYYCYDVMFLLSKCSHERYKTQLPDLKYEILRAA